MSIMKRLTWETTEYVLMESTRRAIEKMAEDFARELHSDPQSREELRRDARHAAEAIAESMRINREAEEARKAHSGRKRSPRKTKRRRPGTRTSRTS